MLLRARWNIVKYDSGSGVRSSEKLEGTDEGAPKTRSEGDRSSSHRGEVRRANITSGSSSTQVVSAFLALNASFNLLCSLSTRPLEAG